MRRSLLSKMLQNLECVPFRPDLLPDVADLAIGANIQRRAGPAHEGSGVPFTMSELSPVLRADASELSPSHSKSSCQRLPSPSSYVPSR